jgi:hypothetical protein
MPHDPRCDPMYRSRRDVEEMIILTNRWYILYRLSVLELVEMHTRR